MIQMETLKKVADRYNKLEREMLIIMMAALVIVIFAQVFTRYILGSALYWSEELGKFIFVWMSWLGVSAGMHEKEHIQINLLPDLLHKKGFVIPERIMLIMVDVLWLITNIAVIYYGISIVQGQMKTGVYGASTGIPMWIAYLSVPLTAAICAIRLVVQLGINIPSLFKGKEDVLVEMEDN